MTQTLAVTAVPRGLQLWNYSTYHILVTDGPHGGSWWVAATALAEWGVFPLAFMLVALFFFGETSRDARVAAVGAGVAVLVALVVNHVLGQVWFEPRPYLSQYHLPRLAPAAHGNSFPSDHLAFAGAIVGSLWVTGRRPLAVVGAVLALGVGWARVVGGIHWPLDVIAGVGVGLASGALVGTALPRWPVVGRWLARLPLGPVLSVVGSVAVVGVGFTGLEIRSHLGVVGTEVAEGMIAMGGLGIAWGLGWASRLPGLAAPKTRQSWQVAASGPVGERLGEDRPRGWGGGAKRPGSR